MLSPSRKRVVTSKREGKTEKSRTSVVNMDISRTMMDRVMFKVKSRSNAPVGTGRMMRVIIPRIPKAIKISTYFAGFW
jgi:hypothetical protein